MAKTKPRVAARPKAVPVATKPVGRPRRAASSAPTKRVAGGAKFTVQFQVQTVLTVPTVREALRRVRALGAVEVLAITRES
jgi:hypothetical protein